MGDEKLSYHTAFPFSFPAFLPHPTHPHTHTHNNSHLAAAAAVGRKRKEKASTSSRTSLTVQGLSFAFNKCTSSHPPPTQPKPPFQHLIPTARSSSTFSTTHPPTVRRHPTQAEGDLKSVGVRSSPVVMDGRFYNPWNTDAAMKSVGEFVEVGRWVGGYVGIGR